MAQTHGATGTPEFEAWKRMLARCYTKRNSGYPNYGGRGITVCDRWRESFENFLTDMGPRPKPGFSVERIDNSLGYSPENCRWATRTEQNSNTRRTRLYTIEGETMPLHHWAKRYGQLGTTVMYRLKVGWSLKDALTLPRYHQPHSSK